MASTTTDRPPRAAARDEPERPVVEPLRPGRRLSTRISLLAGLLLVAFAALFLRLWALQVLSGPKYVSQARANSSWTVRVQAPRGPIVDRNGNVLVMNVPATAVQLWPSELPKVYDRRYGELRRLAEVTGVPLYEIAAGIKARRGDVLTPVTVRNDAAGPMVAYLFEHAAEFPGVTLGRSYVRHYPWQSLASQVLGYDGEISAQELQTMARNGYEAGDVIGQSGVEASYDSYLRGLAGKALLHVDSLGRPQGARVVTVQPTAGETVRLTLDLGLQRAAEQALRYGISLAQANHQWAARAGAIVAMNPVDGSILALASYPTYKPSVYTGRVTTRELAAQGLTPRSAALKDYPSLDRALQGVYPPGSVFKPVTALAAMEEHILSPYAYEPCTGTYTAPEDRSHHVFHNWDPNVDQAMDLPTALAYSCDTYFYRVGNEFWQLPGSRGQPLQKWARRFGFGQALPTDAGASVAGLLPTIAWKHAQYTQRTDPRNWQVDRLWKPGDSIQLAIGQGDLLVTPLQMTRFYALLANGGKLVSPHVVMDVENPNGTIVPTPPLPAPHSVGLEPGALAAVQKGLWEGTHAPFGTSYGVFGKFPVSIAGKTGTAQKVVTLPGYRGIQNQSWWCGWGPTGPDPKLVVCAVIENGGHGGDAAAPAAAEVFAHFFHTTLRLAGPIHSD